MSNANIKAPRGLSGSGRRKSDADTELKRLVLARWQADQREMAHWERLKTQELQASNDPRIRTKLGRMYLLRDPVAIDGPMLSVGLRVSEILLQYDFRVLNAYRGVRAQDLARERGRLTSEERIYLVHRARDSYRELLEVLGFERVTSFDRYAGNTVSVRPGAVANATFAMCREESRESLLPSQQIDLAVRGLRKLAEHWGLYAKESAPIQSWRDAEAIAARAARVLTPPD